MNMNSVQLFAVTSEGLLPLPVPADAGHIHNLFDTLPAGFYTALATFEHNKFLLLDDHLDRLENSLILLGWDYRLDRTALCRALHEVVTAYPLPNSRIRLDVLARPVPHFNTDSRLLIALSPFDPIPESLYRDGVVVGTTRGLNRSQPLVKKAAFVLQRRKCLEADSEIYECLMLDEDGYILEGTTSNFYAVRDGVMWTPGQGVLEGVARRLVLEVVADLGLPLRLEPVHVDDISELAEAALSSSSRAIIPIIQIDGRTIGAGRPGPITRRILRAYQDVVAQVIRPAYEVEHYK
jgi:branched-chain amino acid aminotransferase